MGLHAETNVDGYLGHTTLKLLHCCISTNVEVLGEELLCRAVLVTFDPNLLRTYSYACDVCNTIP